MTQNIYDNQAFFDGYAQLPRSRFGLEGAPEWSAIQEMLPDLAGRNVIDLGCGYGWFCRSAREAGASAVTGIDLSEKMLARARQLTRDPGIAWQRADLAHLTLENDRYDLAYSSLALHYLPDLQPLFATVRAALKPGGWLVFSTEHPIFTCPEQQGWVVDDRGQRSWAVNNYQNEGQRSSNWLAEGVIKYHRTLGTLLNLLMAAGFTLREVREWGPTAQQIAEQPDLAEEAERPMLLIVSAQRKA
ncbi:class I SAM-dependent methyltransferase [Erwinia sp. SLM-02]|uniref:class I SAM-dependent methyltransferase n=1 Tax=Erwinia sp. SLM-02 TaxID=3020057 RepID=UPI0028D79F3C|nr:class I SAM-dependent methyltransferase [uncultured Erwinia sp.]